MESENFWIFGVFRNGILFFFGGGESDRSDLSDVSDWSDHQLVDSLTCRLVDLLLVLVFAAVFVGYLLEDGEFFGAVGWVVAFGDGFFHMFVPVEHVVLLKAVL